MKLKMNILLLEDRGSVAYPLREDLEQNGCTVFLAQNISRAKSYWEQEQIDCIIADLNMDPRGLSETEKEQTERGLFSGWVWLKNYVFNKNENMKKKTIILTAYVREFKEKLKNEGLTFSDLGIHRVIPKNPLAAESILEHVRNMKRIEEVDNEKK